MAWLGWDDEKCLEFYNQTDVSVTSEEETLPVYYAYYTENKTTGKRSYSVIPEEQFKDEKVDIVAFDYKRCFNKTQADECVEEWKGENRRGKQWDKYMNS